MTARRDCNGAGPIAGSNVLLGFLGSGDPYHRPRYYDFGVSLLQPFGAQQQARVDFSTLRRFPGDEGIASGLVRPRPYRSLKQER